MNVLNIGDSAPDFNCKDQNGKIINLSDYLGKKLVIFFYPKANTPGCTAQACNLSEKYVQVVVLWLLLFCASFLAESLH